MKKNKSLYNIQQDYVEITQELINLDGEITPELEEKLVLNEKNLKQKSVAYMEVISNSDARILMAKAMKQRAEQVIKQEENKIKYLKDRLLSAVKIFGPFEVGILKFGTRKSKTVVIDPQKVNLIPGEYKKTVVEAKPDKAKIKKALEEGKEIPGCSISHNQNLKIN